MSAALDFGRLLFGTMVHRPYVWAFFACFLWFALKHLGVRATLTFGVVAWLVAFGSEYNSTHQGFPFGHYVYVDGTRDQELWIANVPFWDSLSFVFLSYFSWVVAAAVRSPLEPSRALLAPGTAVLGGGLMMLLDVVIDPVTLLGDRWFLGRIYFYPHGGPYFGVPLTNFLGWWFVGAVTVLAFQGLSRLGVVREQRWQELTRSRALAALGVYAGVLGFNLVVTAWLGQWTLLVASLLVSAVTLLACGAAMGGLVPATRRGGAT